MLTVSYQVLSRSRLLFLSFPSLSLLCSCCGVHEDSTYSVDENSGVVEVCADLLIGELEGVDAVVQLTTQSGTCLRTR